WVAEMVRPRSLVATDTRAYGLGFWLDLAADSAMLTGSDAGVSFRTEYRSREDSITTLISNTTHGTWSIARRLAERRWHSARSVRLRGLRREPLALAARRQRLPLRSGELHFPQPDRLRRHLDRLVVPDELERLLERQDPRRNQSHELVGGRCAHVGQPLRLRRVHVEVFRARVLADDHPFVELVARLDEQRA